MLAQASRSAIRSVYHGIRFPYTYLRARKIAMAYAAHYRAAQELFYKTNRGQDKVISTLNEVRAQVSIPGTSGNLLEFPTSYVEMIDRLGKRVEERLAKTENCFFFPRLASCSLPEMTEEVEALRNGLVTAIQLKDYSSSDELESVCRVFLPQVEQKIYGAYVIVDKVYVYRNVVSRLDEQVSWLWHYDNHPAEILKIMIYLTDVTEQHGPLEYLRSRETRQAVLMTPTPLCGYGRISRQAIERRLADGEQPHKVIGPKGTAILFDNNIVHKANIPTRGYRDAVVLQIRPSAFRPAIYIGPQWTGSFQHVDFSADPYDYQPRPKSKVLSG